MTALTTAAGSLPDTQQQAGADQYLTFVLAGETYALGLLNVKEIINYDRQLTEVPMMPALIRGVINLRGSVVPVVDLAARFGKGRTQIAKRTSIVIVETSGDDANGSRQKIGVIVDAVSAVVDIDSQHIEPTPDFGINIRPDFVSGMAKSNGRFVMLLNVDTVLSVDEMADLCRRHEEHGQQGDG